MHVYWHTFQIANKLFYEKIVVVTHSNNWPKYISITAYESSSCSTITVKKNPIINIDDKYI